MYGGLVLLARFIVYRLYVGNSKNPIGIEGPTLRVLFGA